MLLLTRWKFSFVDSKLYSDGMQNSVDDAPLAVCAPVYIPALDDTRFHVMPREMEDTSTISLGAVFDITIPTRAVPRDAKRYGRHVYQIPWRFVMEQ